ncbi:hypothetical protein GOP47_0018063 [Adiantum capillus-veneris]|uniref:Tim44-like domain-containing protein n=1 Tax=Adiantum capillus-veneris TaxID=13818 RepID=A0A9D4UGN2_ADICA|nr:hypothetical protein GOP47_0018063 [Adiantum capillus-veneris]
MNAGRLLAERRRLLSVACLHYQLRCQTRPSEGHVLVSSRAHVRHMGIFREFSKRLKGEMEKNPELQKSIQDLKETACSLKHRTKETTEKLYKHVGVVREEAGTRARQVSDVLKERVHGVKERVSEATSQVKESISASRQRERETPISSQSRDGASETVQDKGSTGEKEASSKEEISSRSLFGHFAKGFNVVTSTTSSLLSKVKSTKLVDIAKQSYKSVRDELTTTSTKRKKAKFAATSSAPRSNIMDVVPVERKRSFWEKRWDFWKEKAESNRVYKRFKGVKQHPVVLKGQEIAEDMRERWETSDSPVVHKIQDLNESLFGETATAMALKAIRRRDPTFSFPDFLSEVQENARDVLQAYLKGDIEELRKRCSREVVDRCRAERKAYESQGIFFDNKILHVSDLELKETKLLGNVPIIIVTFQTQQIFCVRDKHGKITQGAKDDILTVYYAWAMQQVSPEEMEEGEIFPQWQLREMQQLGVQAII